MKTKNALFGLAILLSSFSNLSAQWYIGGALSGSLGNNDFKEENTSNNSESKQSQLVLSPKVGYFLSENFMVGLGFNLGLQKNETKYISNIVNGINYYTNQENKSKSISFEPFVRYYVPLSEKISFINHLGLSYGFSNIVGSSYTDNSEYKNISESKGNVIRIGYYPGISLNITEKFLIELGIGSIGYSHNKSEYTQKSENSNSGVVDEGDKETSTSSNFNIRYNDLSLGLAFKF